LHVASNSDVPRCVEAPSRVPRKGGLAPYRGVAENDDVGGHITRLYHVTTSGSGSGFVESVDRHISVERKNAEKIVSKHLCVRSTRLVCPYYLIWNIGKKK